MAHSRSEFLGWGEAYDPIFTCVSMMSQLVPRLHSCLFEVQAMRAEMQELRTFLNGIAEKIAVVFPGGVRQDVATIQKDLASL